MWRNLSIWIIFTIWSITQGETYSGVQEFCLKTGFEANCGEHEIIIIKSARYGRMRLGKCVVGNYGSIGCSTDVSYQMTKNCSGINHCTITNLERFFSGAADCPQDLKSYLEASWSCLSVLQGTDEECNSYGYLQSKGTSGVISSSEADNYGYGTNKCPWLIRAEAGQQINITLVNFNTPQEQGMIYDDHLSQPRYCKEYAILKEDQAVRSIVYCDGDHSEKHVYVTKGHTLEIVLEESDSALRPNRYILKYEVIGCKLPKIPRHMRVIHKENTLAVHCNNTSESWKLTCENGKWVGLIGNCTTQTLKQHHQEENSVLPLGITLMIIIGVAFLICLVTLIIGVFHLSKKRPVCEPPELHDTLLYNQESIKGLKMTPIIQQGPMIEVDTNRQFASIDRRRALSPEPRARISQSVPGGDYSQIWELTHQQNQQFQQVSTSAAKTPTSPRETYSTFPKDKLQYIDKKRASFTTFKPCGENLYQSPMIDRKQVIEGQTILNYPPFYFELDPNNPQAHVVHHPDCILSAVEVASQQNL